MNKQEITDVIKARFASARDRGKVLARALGIRAEIAAVRRRLRATFAELGEDVYGKMAAGKAKGWGDAPGLAEFKTRIEGLHAELGQREVKLTGIMAGEEKKEVEKTDVEKTVVEEKPDEGAQEAARSKAGK